ncbi:Aste57867_20034 [Aphanomyces stellatus]|uniref:Aste57867_20034 protein n=1 Tax=Aphanomyces stellatus TaxID=120398 RepID=A0A485LFJ8_9STRA|nr:hypothetical protein As57867_019968 [Aphanomyces stellatus]VFT96730.1 Aste57867_20034 [Aphanomyces stellatus]
MGAGLTTGRPRDWLPGRMRGFYPRLQTSKVSTFSSSSVTSGRSVKESGLSKISERETTAPPPLDYGFPVVELDPDMPSHLTGLHFHSHSLVGHGAFRARGYKWIVADLQPKLVKAIEYVDWYLHFEVPSELPRLFVGTNFVDIVRDCVRPTPLDRLADRTWTNLTRTPMVTASPLTIRSTATRTTKELDRMGDDVSYVQLRLAFERRPHAPVVVNLLYKRTLPTRTCRRVEVMFRSIAEDDRFPLPKQPTRLRVHGWIALESSDGDFATRERAFVRMEARHGHRMHRQRWLMEVVQEWIHAQETALLVALGHGAG